MARGKVVPEHKVELFGCFAYRPLAPFGQSGEAADEDPLGYARSASD